MQTINAKAGQAWVDLALQYLGDENRLFELCDLNGAGITDPVDTQVTLIAPNYAWNTREVVRALQASNPASRCDGDEEQEGIGYWTIEMDFRIR